jgi:TonB family protein
VKRPLKPAFLLVITLLVFGAATVRGNEASASDDVATAKAAFVAFRKYENTDDVRILDLFSPNCSITFVTTDGKVERTTVVPSNVFREIVRKDIGLKHGNRETLRYDDVQFSKKGRNILLNARFHSSDSNKGGSLFAAYGRDDRGALRIQQFRITAIVDHQVSDYRTMFVAMPAPEYPTEMLRRGATAKALFRLAVNEHGQVTSVTALKSTGHPEFDASCEAAFRKWRARPGAKRQADVPVTFVMGSSGSSGFGMSAMGRTGKP